MTTVIPPDAPIPTELSLALPEWLRADLPTLPRVLDTPELRMRLVIELARKNFERDTGGPFAAAVFEEASGRLVALGVNRVVPTSCSSAHAEVVALSLAQSALGTFDLGGPSLPAHELVVNWRPCAMCFGAVLWSGVRTLLVAGGGAELEALTGFDEGPLPEGFRTELERRGVRYEEGLLRDESWAVFRDFAASGKLVYNGRRGAAQP